MDPVLITEEAVRHQLKNAANVTKDDIEAAVSATEAYVLRYHSPPAEGGEWPADYKLGAAMLAAGLITNANAPGIKENAFGGISDTSFRRATDVKIEQLLRIGRFAKPRVG